MNDLFSVAGKVILVTGGAQGLGRMISEGLVRAGARVYITSRKADICEAAAEDMRANGFCRALPGDLSTPEAAVDLINRLKSLEPKLHVIVNNAGKTWGGPLDTFPDKAWASVMAVNVQTPFTIVREALPLLEAAATPEDPARVINIGSVAGAVYEPLNAYSYAASKAAIHHLSRVMAADLAPRNIAVNVIVPGYFPTNMTAHIRADEEKADELNAHIPLKRVGAAGDIASAVQFLSSPASAYITGVAIPVDGGLVGCR